MPKALIIGGTGLMGPHLVRELAAQNLETICINRSGVHPLGGTAYACDRNIFSQIKDIFAQHEDYVLFDMVPYTAMQAGIVIHALNGKKPPMVCASSCDVYEAFNVLHRYSTTLQPTPLTEISPLRDRLSFQGSGYDKLNVEHIYFSYFESCAIVRLPAIYGLPDRHRIEDCLKKFEKQEVRIHPDFASWRFCRSSNRNCAFGMALCVKNQGRHAYNLAEPYTYSESEWMQKIFSLAHIQAAIIHDENEIIPHQANPAQHLVCDSAKIRQQLGYWEKYDTDQTILEVIEKYKSNE
jgi:nucleoside-diphosphate-sugar epimerase